MHLLIMTLLFSVVYASEISRISLAELQEKSDLIVLAEVIEIRQDGNSDLVMIQIDSFLKGNGEEKILTIRLETRGGLKDFDPALNKGETGVFFLHKDQDGFSKAYWGSMAIFAKNNFHLSDLSYWNALEIWCDMRLQQNPDLDIADYEKGF
ncbi:MAG: hypothetical protein JW996_06890, partial [Candidatus Cloacimonetes bacterium]|nr:hypothetical protein [Candidatus Cloacimonadota bacterium]